MAGDPVTYSETVSDAFYGFQGPYGPWGGRLVTCAIRIAPAMYVSVCVRTHARRFLDKACRNVNMFVYRIHCRPFGGSRAPCPPLSSSPPLSTGRIPCVFHFGSRTPERDTRTGGRDIARASHFPLIQDPLSGFPTYSPSASPCECHVLPERMRACVACVAWTRAAGRVLVIARTVRHGTMCLAYCFELIT